MVTREIKKGCSECGTLINTKKIVERYKVPFKCSKCGSIKFPYRALNGVVFIWPKPIEETTRGGIVIPEFARPNFKHSVGIVLSSGKGVVAKQTGQYIESELTVGDVVLYNKGIPWNMNVVDPEGKEQNVDLMNLLDINAISECD